MNGRWWRYESFANPMEVCCLLVTFFLALQGCTFPVKQMEFSAIQGRVVDKDTGAPVEGAVVYVHWQAGQESLMERYPAETLFAAEAVTDEMGRFSLPSARTGIVSFSRHLHYNAPLIGIVRDGYGIYHTTLLHNTSYGLPNRQIHQPNAKRCCTFELKKMSVRDTVLGEGALHSRFASRDLTWIANSDCWWEHIPQTIRAMDRLTAAVARSGFAVTLFSHEDIPSSEECKDAQVYFEKGS